MTRHPTPLATVARQAFRSPAGLLADIAFGVAWQIAFPPVMLMVDIDKLLTRKISGVLLAVSHSEILAFRVHEVFTYFTVDGLTIIQSFPADIAKFPLMMERFRPTVSYRILDEAGGDAGTRGHHSLQAAIMHYEVANFADEALLDEAP